MQIIAHRAHIRGLTLPLKPFTHELHRDLKGVEILETLSGVIFSPIIVKSLVFVVVEENALYV